ncbi:NPP1 family protein [Mycetocola saprophilus]|uniref:NPP1 family protein n=1 Tax=Mycetocola saprophilus TaxID=76636 RepID=UPI0009DECB69|nr:NPP1 family protein [Mycetocola saprophilus]
MSITLDGSASATTTAPRSARRAHKIAGVLLGAACALALTIGAPLTAQAEVFQPLPQNADGLEQTFSPAYDYDTDGCYATAAISASGKINPGLGLGGAVNGHCHDAPQLQNSNTYSREKCNNGWCAIMYASYFEKDQASNGVGEIAGGTNGHRNDWEHVVVWVQNNQVKYVSRSVHNGWQVDPASKVRFDGTHAKVVYHKEGGFTHYFRLANASDDRVENVTGNWFYPRLVGWNGYPSDYRNRLMNANFGAATIKINDQNFNWHLGAAKPAGISFNPNA